LDELDTPIVETASAPPHSPIVTPRSRRGVTHDHARVCSQARAPEAPAAAAMAQAAHMWEER